MARLPKLLISKIEKPNPRKVLSFQTWSSRKNYGVDVYASPGTNYPTIYRGTKYFSTKFQREKAIPKLIRMIEKDSGKKFKVEVR
jgi:hypothetical protein